MKSASGALITLLNTSTQFLMADLYTITLIGGTVLRYTSADVPITVSGNTFLANDVKITRGRVRQVAGLEVGTLDIEVFADSTSTLGGTAWLTAARLGALDGAQIKLERAFMPTWGDTSAGTLIVFSGVVSEVVVGRISARIKVKSDIAALETKLPRTIYQQGCNHTLYSAGCTVNRSTVAVNTTVASGATVSSIPIAAVYADEYFSLGILKFTSGVNNGVQRTVKRHVSGVLSLMLPLQAAPSTSDTCTVWPGCDKTQNTCTTKFNNLANFRGFPYVPIPEAIL